jgi:Neurotransmitter-gated ion-channel ligand binding domain
MFLRRKNGSKIFGLIISIILMGVSGHALAKETRRVQEITGHVELKGRLFYYNLPNLQQGQTLYVFMEGTSHSLDPFVALLKPGTDVTTIREDYLAEQERLVAAGRDPLVVMPEVLKKFTLFWDDDGGPGYSAAFAYHIPQDGDYQLVATSTLARRTFGDYRLLIGINAPEVLTGRAKPTGAAIAVRQRLAFQFEPKVEEVFGTISSREKFRFYPLPTMRAGETLSVFVEALAGALKPIVVLYDYGEKPLDSANFFGKETQGTFSYTFPEDQGNCRLKITGLNPQGKLTTGDYRIVLGLNAPQVLTGEVKGTGQQVVKGATQVKIGFKLQQITDVNQRSENYSVAGTLGMQWQDPQLAFSPDKVQNRIKVFTGERFLQYTNDNNIAVPNFTIYNQQGKRWTQNTVVAIWPDGKVEYYERFSTTLQAPDFDFRRFPFDTQRFFLRVDNLWPEWYFNYAPLEGFSEVGQRLGEEEWVITKHEVTFDSVMESYDRPVSRFIFAFQAKRHTTYYFFRILLPLIIIIVVAWFSFFLKDYSKRVDVAGANLLIFIAFNFTIATELPRLGYLTFMDTLLVTTFIITGVVVIISYQLRRMVDAGKHAQVARIDKYIRWFYPLAYLLGIGSVTYLFG